ncbi:MAG: CRISPR-associated endonuclease Cas2 [bacterium]
MPKKISIATKLLLGLVEMAEVSADHLDAFLLSAGSASLLQKNLNLLDTQYHSSLQGLEKHGYIQKINKNQFLISPKAQRKIRKIKNEQIKWDKKKWNGMWIIVAFDIPEPQKNERDAFRCAIKREGFIRLQNSVFVAPFADLGELSRLRVDLKIEEYVTFFQAKSCETEDDSKLKKRFGL